MSLNHGIISVLYESKLEPMLRTRFALVKKINVQYLGEKGKKASETSLFGQKQCATMFLPLDGNIIQAIRADSIL